MDVYEQFLDAEIVEEGDSRWLLVLTILIPLLIITLPFSWALALQKSMGTEWIAALTTAGVGGGIVPITKLRKHRRRLRELQYLKARMTTACKGTPPDADECQRLRKYLDDLAMPKRPE